jgi:hypothetical protein
MRIVWGIPEKVKEIAIPKGAKLKLRFRPHTHGKAFVRVGNVTKCHHIEINNGVWELGRIVGINHEL